MHNKLKAFIIHLGISLVIALLTVILVFFVWYPTPLHKALAVTEIFLLLLLVDVVLGPLLTFIVYKKGKLTLVMDLAVIAALQLSALTYGLWTVSEGRPAWIVFGGNHFELVRKVDIEPRDLQRKPSWLGPEWVSIQEPLKLSHLLFKSDINSTETLYRQPKNYRALSHDKDRIKRRALPLALLEKNNSTTIFEAVLNAWPEADGWFPLNNRGQSLVVLVNKETAEALAIVNLKY